MPVRKPPPRSQGTSVVPVAVVVSPPRLLMLAKGSRLLLMLLVLLPLPVGAKLLAKPLSEGLLPTAADTGANRSPAVEPEKLSWSRRRPAKGIAKDPKLSWEPERPPESVSLVMEDAR